MADPRGPEFRYPARRQLSPRVALGALAICIVAAVSTTIFLRVRESSGAGFGVSAVLRAMSSVRRATVTFWSLHHGSRYVNEVREFDKGRWRVDGTDGKIWLERPGSLITRLPGASVAIDFKDTSQFSLYGPTFTLEGLDNPVIVAGGRGQVVKATPGSGGKTFDLYLYGTFGLSYRMLFTIDGKTKLPIEDMLEAPGKDGKWVVLWGEDIVYGKAISQSRFDPAKLQGVKVVSAADQQKRVQKALGPALARHQLGFATFEVRDAEVNSRGDLFLAYTGNLPINMRVTAQDGTLFVPSLVTTYDESQARVGGQPLRYSFWVSTAKSPLRQAQTFLVQSLADKHRRKETGWQLRFHASTVPNAAPGYAMETGSIPGQDAIRRDRWQVLEQYDQFCYLSCLKKNPDAIQATPEELRFLEDALRCRNCLIDDAQSNPSMDDIGRARTLSSMLTFKSEILRELRRMPEAEQVSELSKSLNPLNNRLD